ncbi:hypothetical protein V6N11_030776 [Hibiscus sabdariffa]|uniref:Reverse transcriptase zinc-binding domain-containing protein n=1 Tax=Hibiscus sabdariffa TaxID=183260 RepID=A0ABR2N773_9ROSI
MGSGIETSLPRERLELIATIQPQLSHLGEDKPMWRWEDKRNFNTLSTYSFFTREDDRQFNSAWKKIWRLETPQRIRVFVWLAFQERLLTNVE